MSATNQSLQVPRFAVALFRRALGVVLLGTFALAGLTALRQGAPASLAYALLIGGVGAVLVEAHGLARAAGLLGLLAFAVEPGNRTELLPAALGSLLCFGLYLLVRYLLDAGRPVAPFGGLRNAAAGVLCLKAWIVGLALADNGVPPTVVVWAVGGALFLAAWLGVVGELAVIALGIVIALATGPGSEVIYNYAILAGVWLTFVTVGGGVATHAERR